MATTIDQLLTQHAKSLKAGESVTFTLVVGPTTTSVDPIQGARRQQHRSVTSTKFPKMAKFMETVQKPDFNGLLKDGRMYEEDIPKIQDESDDDEGETIIDPKSGETIKKKKRRWKRHEAPRQHWILQEKSEFIKKMRAKKQKRQMDPTQHAMEDEKLSTRYEGLPESNASHYVTFSVQPAENTSAPPPIVVTNIHGFQSFTQPQKFATLSMHEAERAINDQRANMTRYMMHAKKNADPDGSNTGSGTLIGGPIKKMGMAKARLLGKLVAGKKDEGDNEGEDDDVMGDLAFRTRKGGANVKARKELLNSMGDEGLTVDGEGVLGGTNDAEFGGARRFGRLAVPTKKAEGPSNEDGDDEGKKDETELRTGGGGGTAAASNDGMAMEEDFYQRDVSAEYEDLDYDANEQFDDDDVDVGADEVEDTGGFAADLEEEEEDVDDFDEEGVANALESGLEGFATSAGMRAMVAKAKGETLLEDGGENVGSTKDGKPMEAGQSVASIGGKERSEVDSAGLAGGKRGTAAPSTNGGLEKVMAAAKKKAEEAQKKKDEPDNITKSGTSKKRPAAGAANQAVSTGVEVDDHGQRILSLEAIRREIWLHHGAIQTKRLMKIFDIKKKSSADRQNKFRDLVKELCSITQDKVEGNKLVLKQHYSNMG